MTSLGPIRVHQVHHPISSILNCEKSNKLRSKCDGKTSPLPLHSEINQDLQQNDLIFLVQLSHSHAHVRRQSSPSPPLVLHFPAVLFSPPWQSGCHTDVISSPTAGAYGNVTGGRWTWWLLTHSSPPTGRALSRTSPVSGETGLGRSLTQMLTQIIWTRYIYTCTEYVILSS